MGDPGGWRKGMPKDFDAIAWKREVQEQFAKETAGMTPAEVTAYIRRRVAESEFAQYFTPPEDDPSKQA